MLPIVAPAERRIKITKNCQIHISEIARAVIPSLHSVRRKHTEKKAVPGSSQWGTPSTNKFLSRFPKGDLLLRTPLTWIISGPCFYHGFCFLLSLCFFVLRRGWQAPLVISKKIASYSRRLVSVFRFYRRERNVKLIADKGSRSRFHLILVHHFATLKNSVKNIFIYGISS